MFSTQDAMSVLHTTKVVAPQFRNQLLGNGKNGSSKGRYSMVPMTEPAEDFLDSLRAPPTAGLRSQTPSPVLHFELRQAFPDPHAEEDEYHNHYTSSGESSEEELFDRRLLPNGRSSGNATKIYLSCFFISLCQKGTFL